MKHNPLVTPSHPDPGWQAWCICGWESPTRTTFHQAKNDKLAHEGKEPEPPPPPWIRGPG